MPIVNVIYKNELEGATRIDPEYYQPVYFELEEKLKKVGSKTIEEISSKVANFGAYSLCNYIEYIESGIPYLNVKNIKSNFVDFTSMKYISPKVHAILPKSKVMQGQILLTMAGTIGVSAVAHDLPTETNSNQAIAKVTLSDDDFSPYFVSTFLNTKYGRLQTERLIVSNVQPNLLLVQVKSIKIPLLSRSFQNRIEESIKQALEHLKNANRLYLEAEQKFLHETLGGAMPSEKLAFTVDLSKCSLHNRLDAEYYQPKYDKLIDISKKRHTLEKLGDIANVTKGVEVGSTEYLDEGIPFIRVSNLSKLGINVDNQKFISHALYDRLREKYEPRKGEVLITKDGTPGIVTALDKSIRGIISSGILRLSLKKNMDPQFLAVALNSIYVQMQIQRDAGGSIIEHWRPDQIKSTLIPILSPSKQKEIAALATKSHNERNIALTMLMDSQNKIEQELDRRS